MTQTHQEEGATGQWANQGSKDNPVWYRVLEPTKAQVNAALKVGHKEYDLRLNKWAWRLLLDFHHDWSNASSHGVYNYLRDYSVPDFNAKYLKPNRFERDLLRERGTAIFDQWLDDFDTEAENRAWVWTHVSACKSALDHGDLPAAIEALILTSPQGGLTYSLKRQLIASLDGVLIHFPHL